MELGGYLVVGASASRALHGGRLRWSLRVTSPFDTDYAESIGFPAPGRALLLAFGLD